MSKSGKPTCEECYFRKSGLCALAGNTVCPTFRVAQRGTLAPPRQPPLVARPLAANAAA
jgi:hypothetical protein